LLSAPPVALVSARLKPVGASLNVNVTLPVGFARFTSVLSIETATVGVTLSTVNGVVLPLAPGLPFPSCQLPAVTATAALPMSVLAAPVNVAV
jgi:hypothetical protein